MLLPGLPSEHLSQLGPYTPPPPHLPHPRSADDVQVSFVMLDPYVRQPLVAGADGTFKLAFKVPDVYGVFKYVIDYRHAGYSYINLQEARGFFPAVCGEGGVPASDHPARGCLPIRAAGWGPCA